MLSYPSDNVRSLLVALQQEFDCLMNQISADTRIVDRYFLNSFKKLKQQLKTQIYQYSLRLIGIAIILTLNHYSFAQTNQDSKQAYSLFLQIILAQNFADTVRLIYFYFTQIDNKEKVFFVAAYFNHCRAADEMRIVSADDFADEFLLHELDTDTGLSASLLFYDFQNKEKNADVSEQHKTMRENLGCTSIKNALELNLCYYRFLGYLLYVTSTLQILYGVVLCFQVPITQNQSSFIQIYIFLEFLYKPKILAILIIIFVTPIICSFAVLYLCFCKRSTKANLPKPTEVTTQVLARCSECAICFQTFVEQEQIIELPCSNLHVFHDTCILGWTKVKPNCPICRHDLV